MRDKLIMLSIIVSIMGASGLSTWNLKVAEELRRTMQKQSPPVEVEKPIAKPTAYCNTACTARLCSVVYGDQVTHRLLLGGSGWQGIVTDIEPRSDWSGQADRFVRNGECNVVLTVRYGAPNQSPTLGPHKAADCELLHCQPFFPQ